MKSAVCSICSLSLTDDQWLYAIVSQYVNDLGIRRVSSLVFFVLLASAADTRGFCIV